MTARGVSDIHENDIHNADPEIQDVLKKCLKLSLTKKNHFAYIQKEEIDRWFSTFIAEVRRVDGDKYPPRNIHKLLSGILRYMRYYSCDTPNVLYRRDTRFKVFARSCFVSFVKLSELVSNT